MTDGLVKVHWIVRVKQTAVFHLNKIKENPYWRSQDTAKILNRSQRRIDDDLLLATWLKTHEDKLKRFKNISDALAWVRLKRKELKLSLLDHSEDLQNAPENKRGT